MNIFRRLARKLMKRTARKGKALSASYLDKPKKTTAFDLISNNWGIRFSNKEPERNGLYRAIDRENQQRRLNAAKPASSKFPPSRQVKRQEERRQFKIFRRQIKNEMKAQATEQRRIQTADSLSKSIGPVSIIEGMS